MIKEPDSIMPVPEITVRRLPKYLQYMKKAQEMGKIYISATEMAEFLGIHHTQVRKDLESMGSVGKPKVGHTIADSITAITSYLGWGDTSSAFLIGAGNLGSALLGYRGFEQSGIKVISAFDSDEEKFGRIINGIEVFPLDKFVNLANRMHIRIAILTAPHEAADELQRLIVKTEIKAVWNFMPVSLELPQDIIVEDANLYSSLAVLSRKLKETTSVTR